MAIYAVCTNLKRQFPIELPISERVNPVLPISPILLHDWGLVLVGRSPAGEPELSGLQIGRASDHSLFPPAKETT